MQSATVVTAYRSPFDADVDPRLPSWKRDLIIRRRAMSRTMGSPVPGMLDVASILAMSRSSSGGLQGLADRINKLSIKPSAGGEGAAREEATGEFSEW